MGARRREGVWSALILFAASLVGVVSFIYPFFVPDVADSAMQSTAHAQDAPLVFIVLVALCLGAVVSNLGRGRMDAKTVAVLGILSAVNAVLRFVPGPAGFAAVFFLPVLSGYVFGPTFGFLLGAISLLVSALIGAGVGPWLPYQMFGAGWVGLLSGLLPESWLSRWRGGEAVLLAVWGFVLGLAYGAIMNVWFWPFVAAPGQSAMYWEPGIGVGSILQRYAVFYAVTSLGWDLGRAGGNLLLLLLFGAPLLRLLRRFRQRFHFEVTVALDDPSASRDDGDSAAGATAGPTSGAASPLPHDLQLSAQLTPATSPGSRQLP